MNNRFSKALGFGLFSLLLLITSCSEATNTEQPASTTVESEQAVIQQEPSASSQSLAPGDYCFKIAEETITGSTRLSIASDNRVTGTGEAVIRNEKEGYFTSYQQVLKGTLSGEQLKLDVTTDIENDTQSSQETWKLTENTLDTDRNIYQKVDCSALNSDQSNGDRRLSFASGSNSAVVENAVVRGDRDTYLLNARANQKMALNITSVENNAVFDVVAPNGETLKQEATNSSLVLPATGDYSVVVGGTRGNATYKLQVEIN
ncbi:MAG: hypothetical protein KME06_10675 [Kastovskya adunca ATA6-11-RM4]|jgi:hypothetical protein|nr:hypothetical protein [Kastovskya adunca ATA6-11-RM4]